MTRTRVLTAAVLAGLTVAGVGTAATAFGSDTPGVPAAPTPVTVVARTSGDTPTSTPATPASTTITADDAAARALARLGGGTVTEIEREVEHGRSVWEVDVRGGTGVTEVHVDAATGTVTRVRADDDRIDDKGHHDRDDDRGGHR